MKYLILLLVLGFPVYAAEPVLNIDSLKSDIASGIGTTRDLQNVCFELKKEKRPQDAISFLTVTAIENKDDEMKACALSLSIPLLVKSGDIEKAIENGEYVINKYYNTTWAKECLYTIGEIYRDLLNNEDKAEKYFEKLKRDFPDK